MARTTCGSHLQRNYWRPAHSETRFIGRKLLCNRKKPLAVHMRERFKNRWRNAILCVRSSVPHKYLAGLMAALMRYAKHLTPGIGRLSNMVIVKGQGSYV